MENTMDRKMESDMKTRMIIWIFVLGTLNPKP